MYTVLRRVYAFMSNHFYFQWERVNVHTYYYYFALLLSIGTHNRTLLTLYMMHFSPISAHQKIYQAGNVFYSSCDPSGKNS